MQMLATQATLTFAALAQANSRKSKILEKTIKELTDG